VEIEFSPRVTNASLSAEKGSKVAISAVVIVAAKSWLDDFGPWRKAPSADCARLAKGIGSQKISARVPSLAGRSWSGRRIWPKIDRLDVAVAQKLKILPR
jgi:hypothetical protein